MSNTALAVIAKELNGAEVLNKISASLGKPATDPGVMKFIHGAIMEIESRIGSKSDITLCTKQSIIDSLIKAATVKLPVDSRKLAHLVPFGKTCTFMPDYKGYIYKVKEADNTAEVTVGVVYKGDVFTCSRTDGQASYNHVPANAFEDDAKNITGLYCYVKTDSGSWIDTMSHKELMKVKAQSKMVTGFIWNTWEVEMLKKSIVRRALKIKFTEAISELDALDNKLFNDRPEKIAPSLADATPLPAEKDAIQEAEVVHDDQEEGQKEPENTTAAAKEEGKKEDPGTVKDLPGDLLEVVGAIEKYYEPRGNGPHSWRIEGKYYQVFSKEKDGKDNGSIISIINEHDEKMKSVKILYRAGSYVKDGLTIPVNTIVNAYPVEPGK